MRKEITKAMSLVGLLGMIGCGDIEISYRLKDNIPVACKTIEEDAKNFGEKHRIPSRYDSKCAERAYNYDNTCTIPPEFQALARNQQHAASQYCLWLRLEVESGK